MAWEAKASSRYDASVTDAVPPELAVARERFLELVVALRPELHRYCARLVGSAIEGEDVLQDTLAKAFYALSTERELPPLRPWLFRVAHNTAVDSLRRYERRHVEPRGDFETTAAVDEIDPIANRMALSAFSALPIQQRSAVILKDVLGHSLEELSKTMGCSLAAAKSTLLRGRAALQRSAEQDAEAVALRPDAEERKRLERYVALFNAREWDGLRSILSEECRLDLVGRHRARGKQTHEYYSHYAQAPAVRLCVANVEGHWGLAATTADERPDYFILLSWEQDRVVEIRDFRYAAYVAQEANITAAEG